MVAPAFYAIVELARRTRMRAIQIDRYGGPELLVRRELPIPVPQPDQVLIRLAHSGINFMDVHTRSQTVTARTERSNPVTPTMILRSLCFLRQSSRPWRCTSSKSRTEDSCLRNSSHAVLPARRWSRDRFPVPGRGYAPRTDFDPRHAW
jgi:hypothetical protein